MKLGMNKQDGVVIFYNSKKFELRKRMYLNMFLEKGQNYEFDDVLSNDMYYPSMALFMVLTEKEGNNKGKHVLVVNTHLLFNKNRGHVKLAMVVLIMKAIDAIKKDYGVKDVFMCGDFNLIPNSMLYEYINTGNIDLYCGLRQYSNQAYIMNQTKGKGLVDVIKLADKKFKPAKAQKDDAANKAFLELLAATKIHLPKGQEDEIKVQRAANVPKLSLNDLEQVYRKFSLSVQLKSSYSSFNSAYAKQHNASNGLKQLSFAFDTKTHNNDCFVSQFAQDITVPVDYVWYSCEGGYTPTGVLQTPDPDYLTKLPVSCPVDNLGSDHFSLAVDFGNK